MEEKNDPIKIIENKFSINLSRFNCSIHFFDQHIYPDGDDDCKIILNIHNLPEDIDSYLKSKNMETVPILIKPRALVSTAYGLDKYKTVKKGYYLYRIEGNLLNNYDFLLFDLDNNKIIYLHDSI